MTVKKDMFKGLKFQRYDSRTYNRPHILYKQAAELYNRGLNYVLRGFESADSDGAVVAINPLPDDVTSYIDDSYSSYWFEIVRPAGRGIKVKQVTI